jgi:mycofactocin precursor peptide peptidase
VNGHGGNAAALQRAVTTLTAEGRRVLAWSPSVEGDAHAGRTETAALLALAPSVVRMERAEAGATGPLAELMPALRAGGVASVAPNGVLGDPTGASAEEGRRLLDAMSAALIAAVAEWRSSW